jgi:TRAP-type transport system periplasmic protein
LKYVLPLAVAAVFVAIPAFSQEITLRLAHVLRDGDPAFVAAETFKQEVETATDGAIEVKIFPAGQLGNNRKLFTQIQSGAVDITFTPYNLLSDIEPALNVTAAGYMFSDWNEMKSVLEAPELGQKWQDLLLENGGLRVLAPFYYGTRNLTTTDKEIHSPADLSGMKIRAVPNPMSLANVTGLGAAPTPVAWPETYQSLRQHTVDGQENPIPVLYAAKFYEVQKFLMRTDHQMSVLPILIREQSFSKLSQDQQRILTDAAVVAAKAGTTAMFELTESLVKDLNEKGMTIVDLTDEEKEVFRASVQAVLEKDVDGKAIPKGLMEQVRQFLAAKG